MVNFSAIAGIHQRLMYTDKCTIYVYGDEVDDDGAVKTGKPSEPTYKDIPCKVSFSLRTMETFNKNVHEKTSNEKQPKIFISKEYKVPSGSYIEADKLDDNGDVLYTYKGQSSIPAFCLTHQEIFILMRQDA